MKVEFVNLVCACCGKKFVLRSSAYRLRTKKTKSGLYCGHRCAATANRRTPPKPEPERQSQPRRVRRHAQEEVTCRNSQCQSKFHPLRSGRLYCSHACYTESRRVPPVVLPCEVCGVKVNIKNSYHKQRLKRHPKALFYCAEHKRKGRPRGVFNLVPVVIVCAYCEQEFQLLPSEAARRKASKKNPEDQRLWCSHSCSASGIGRRQGARRIKRLRGWTDERYEWELRLQQEGLGMETHRSRIDYGHEFGFKDERTSTRIA